MEKTKEREELEQLALSIYKVPNGIITPPDQTYPFGFRKFFKAFLSGYNQSLYQNEKLKQTLNDYATESAELADKLENLETLLLDLYCNIDLKDQAPNVRKAISHLL